MIVTFKNFDFLTGNKPLKHRKKIKSIFFMFYSIFKGLPPLPQLIPSSITPPTSPSTSSSTSTSPESSASLSSSRDGSLSPPEEVERALGTGLPGTPGPLASWISRDQGMFVIKVIFYSMILFYLLCKLCSKKIKVSFLFLPKKREIFVSLCVSF